MTADHRCPACGQATQLGHAHEHGSAVSASAYHRNLTGPRHSAGQAWWDSEAACDFCADAEHTHYDTYTPRHRTTAQ